MEFLFPPSSSKDGNTIRKRLLIEAQKSHEKQKLAQEQLAQIQATRSEATLLSERAVYESTSLYFADLKQEEDDEGDDTDSNISGTTLFFHNEFLDKCCSRLISTHRGFVLSSNKFLCIAFILQVPLHYFVQHVQHIRSWGALLVLIMYLVIGTNVCVPIYMYYSMVGCFTRRSYIRYWDCVPLLKGVGFTLAAVSLYQQMYNAILSAIALEYMVKIISTALPWENCNFTRASSSCVAGLEEYPHYNFSCCPYPNCTEEQRLEHTFRYAAYDYYQHQVLKLGYDDIPEDTTYNWKLATTLIVVWIIVYITLVAGIKRFATYMAVINLCMYCLLLPVVVLTFVIGPEYSMIWLMSNDMNSLLDYKFWFQTGINIIHREIPTDVISFSSISKVGFSITVDAVICCIMRLFFTAMFTIWVSIGVTYQQRRYNMTSPECIDCNPDVIFFALFPDIISDMYVPQIWLILYFLLLCLWGISTVIYVYNAFLDALAEEFRALEKWRLLTAAVLCSGAGLGAATSLNPTVMVTMRDMITNVIPQVTVFLLCISLIGLYFYSMVRFKTDYHFFTREILGIYWIVALKVSILLILMAAGIVWIQVLSGNVSNPIPLYIALSVVIIGMLVSALRYGLKISKTLISPSPNWGPPGRRLKLARIKFDPTHDLHHMSMQKCPHECLLYSAALQKEVKFWNKRNVDDNSFNDLRRSVIRFNNEPSAD